MIKRITACLATMAVVILSLAAINAPAQAAPKVSSSGVNAKSCGSSDPNDVQVNKKTDTVTVLGDTSTGGNNFYCYTNISVVAGDMVTFDFVGTCGGGAPRVFLQFDNGAVPGSGENTHDAGTCTMNADLTGGSVTYSIQKDGTITAFAMIHDRDNGSTTYRNLVIAGTRINF